MGKHAIFVMLNLKPSYSYITAENDTKKHSGIINSQVVGFPPNSPIYFPLS
jgi:hypothetical protein